MKINPRFIKTNENCNGCNKCLTVCPIPGANISLGRGEEHRVEVNSERCVTCGLCIPGCQNQAREVVDASASFLDALAAGKKFSLVLDPSLKLLYAEELPPVLGYLRALGVEKIYDISFGGDLCTWATLAYYQQHPKVSKIASFCPVIVNLIEKYYPDLLPYLLPVQSPFLCLMTYLKKYLQADTPLVYIGPCLSKGEELEQGVFDLAYTLTMDKLLQRLAKVDLQAYRSEVDLSSPDLGSLYGIRNGLNENLAYFMPPHFSVLLASGLESHRVSDPGFYKDALTREKVAPLLLHIRSGHSGCVDAPSIPDKEKRWTSVFAAVKEIHSHILARPDYGKSQQERAALLAARFAALDPLDFRRTFTNRYHQEPRLPEDVLEKIFVAMGKTTKAAREINCGSCGYATCREMAWAIAYGYNQIENCIHYATDRTRQITFTDMLTGIPNLYAFKQQTQELFWKHPEQKYVLVYLDIKNFRMVNDLYGFSAGDQILKAVAEHVDVMTREKGTCARIMSDHFVLCLPDSQENLPVLLKYIRENTKKFLLDFPISFDLGLYRIKDTEEPIENMIDRARLAQLTIKGSYDVRWAYYDEAMSEQMRHEAWVTKEMRRALAQEQFQVYLQPQYDHRTRKLVGAEALVRWYHPEKGLISPGEFIPTFEKNNFILEMDAYVRNKVCSLLAEWQAQGLPLVPVSVNLSRLELFEESLPERLSILAAKLPPQTLRLEITESAYTKDPEQLVTMIKKLQDKGFVVEMDDFGSGYSSLNTLHEMPVDVVKLDLRFLTGTHVQKSRLILQAIAGMLQQLQLPVIAEGVETVEQADFLEAIGCHIIQGYYYAKPMPAAQFAGLLARQEQ